MIHTLTAQVPSSGAPSQATLIDETLSGDQARDIMAQMIDSAVNWNKLRNLTSQVHTQQPDSDASQSLQRLQDARATLAEQVAIASARNLKLRIRSTIELVEPEQRPASRMTG